MVYPEPNCQVIIPPDTPDATLFVSVDQIYNQPDPTSEKVPPSADCARGYWWARNLDAASAERCKWLMARDRNIIVGVWKIAPGEPKWEHWSKRPIETRPFPRGTKISQDRYVCLVEDVDTTIWEKFVGKKVQLVLPNDRYHPVHGYFKD